MKTANLHRVVFVVLILLSAMVVSVASAQDDEGPRLTFVELLDGEPVTKTFEGEVNAHLFVVRGLAGDVVTISMTQEENSVLDPYLVLLGPAGEVYVANDDGGEDVPLSALIQDFELPADGTYFVLATSFDGIRNGVVIEDGEEPEPLSYEIVATGMTPVEDVGEEFNYFAGQLEIGNTETLSITTEEPIFYVTFPGEEGETATISTGDTSDEGEVDTLLYLFDPEGNRIAVNDDNGENFFSTIDSVELPVDGLYMVFATAWDYSQAYSEDWTSFGTFTLTIE